MKSTLKGLNKSMYTKTVQSFQDCPVVSVSEPSRFLEDPPRGNDKNVQRFRWRLCRFRLIPFRHAGIRRHQYD